MYTGNRELIKRSRELRKNMTLAEKILWSQLRSKKLSGYKFRRQFPVFEYIVDFYCHELHLIIEIDGPVHDLPGEKEYHMKRERILKANGYTIIRFTNEDIITSLQNTITNIKDFINSNLTLKSIQQIV